ncbi:MAG: 50S ribosomal protein L17 [Deltaproteobacteria bacterium]|nr:50S ribosomal protein L17 [Deltaproteobacteria bacterium]
MRHLVDHRKLGRTAAHRRALFRNMVTSLILNERVETTLAKAKELRGLADRMITWGKQGDLAARRQAARALTSSVALQKLFDGLAGRFKDRQGGYTRLMHLGFRRGDGAPMALLEYLGYELPKVEKGKEKKKEEKKAKIEKKIEKKAAEKEVKAESAPKEKKIKEKVEKEKGEKKGWGIFRRKGQKKEGS